MQESGAADVALFADRTEASAHKHTHTAGESQRSCTVCVTYQAQHVSPLDMKKKQTVT